MIPLAFNLGPWEIGFVAVLALLLFGGRKLPALARDLGQGIREFRRSLSGDIEVEYEEEEKTEKKSKKKKKSKQTEEE